MRDDAPPPAPGPRRPASPPAAPAAAGPDPSRGSTPETEWVKPDPPPIPPRIRKKVAPRRVVLPPLPRFRFGPRVLKAAAAGGLVLLALAIAALVLPTGPFNPDARRQWERLCLDHARWYAAFTEHLSHQDRLTLQEFGLDGVLLELEAAPHADPRFIGQAPRASWAQLIADPPPPARTQGGIDATRLAAASLRRAESALTQWPTRRSLQQHHALFKQHHWRNLAATIGRTLESAPPEHPTAVGPALRVIDSLHRHTAATAAALEKLEADLAVLEPLHDPVFATLIHTVRELDRPLPPPDDTPGNTPDPASPDAAYAQLDRLNQQLQSFVAVAQHFRAYADDGRWAALDHASFRATGRAYALLVQEDADPQAVFKAWLDEADRFRPLDHDWRPAWADAQHALLEQARRDLQPLHDTGHPSAAPLDARREKLAQRIADLIRAPLIAGQAADLDLHRYEIEREVRDFVDTAQQLGQQTAAAYRAQTLRQPDPLLPPDHPAHSPAAEAHWSAYRARLADQLARDPRLAPIQTRLQTRRQLLRGLLDPDADRGLPLPFSRPASSADDATAALFQALADLTLREREGTIKKALAVGLPADADAWARRKTRYAALLEQADALADDAHHAQRVLRGALPLDDPSLPADPEGFPPRLARWATTPLWTDRAVADAGHPLLRRLEALNALRRLTDWDTLSQIAQQAQDPATAFAAWRRLGVGHPSSAGVVSTTSPAGVDPGVAWPGTADSLDTERVLQARLLGLTHRVPDPDRAAALRRELVGRASADRWLLAMAHAIDDAQIRAIAARAPAMDVRVDHLPPAPRYNVLLHRVRQALATLHATDDPSAPPPAARDADVLALVRAFTAATTDQREHPRVGPALADLARLTQPGAASRERFDALGPALAGWTPQPGPDARTVTYTRDRYALSFIRIEPGSADPPSGRPAFYLATTELPVGLALDTLTPSPAATAPDGPRGPGTWADLLPAPPEYPESPQSPDPPDPRRGPRTWLYADPPAPAALRVNPGPWLASGPAVSDDLPPPPPSPAHPINYLSAEASVLLAHTLGCRLPSADEWRRALQLHPPHPDSSLPNLRDTTWARYARLAAQLIGAGNPGLHEAHRDIFRPLPPSGNAPHPAPGSLAENTPGSTPGSTPGPPAESPSRLMPAPLDDHHPITDTTLWLRAASAPAPAAPLDLIGNVAELVTTRPVDLGPLLDAKLPPGQRLVRFRRAHADHFAVVGGSALSPASLALETPHPLNPYVGARGFADVGLRLAFTARVDSPARQAVLALRALPYLKAAAPSATAAGR
ncbi:MAG: hypothetical protein AAGG38_13320 [Planctomycetota bacterium]